MSSPAVVALLATAVRSRNSAHAEADLDIDGRVSITDAHSLAHDAEHRLTHEEPKLRTASIHAYRAHRHDLAAS